MMMLASGFVQHAAAVLATASVAGLWQGATLAVLSAAILRLTPRASAGLRHTLLLASFVAALILPWTSLMPAAVPVPAESHALPIAMWVAAAIALLWLCVACLRASQLLTAWMHLRAVQSRATPIARDGVSSFAAGSRRALLCSSSEVDSPTVLGFRQPRLLLPEWMVPGLSVAELQHIAAHECAHLRRYDDWLNLLLQIALVLSPLNPGLFWLNRRIGVQRELACDEAAVASTAQPVAYASCLARLAEQRMEQRHRRLRLALAAWERRSELALRVHALLQRHGRWSRVQSGFASAGAAALLIAAFAGESRIPQAIRIVDAPAVTIADATASSIVRPSAGTVAAGLPAHGGFRAVPVSFQVQPTSTQPTSTHPRSNGTRRNVGAARKVLLRRAAMRQPTARPRFTRTSYGNPYSVEDDGRLRLVRTEFISPYVAVPVSDGWLLIQL